MSEEQLGGWQVLRPLADDLLGPVWRLGKVGAGGRIEGLALARAFAGTGLEAHSLAEVLDHPFVARTLDVFEAKGRTVVCWEYNSGHSLRQTIEQAADRLQPLSLELSVLIVERIAQGLAAAADKHVAGRPLIHGLLRPELVWITNDGEVKIVGFEVGDALSRRLAGSPAFAPFLDAETRAGSAPDLASTVYALGGLLYTLCTGYDPPSQGAEEAARGARHAEDGTPVPPPLIELLCACLGPRPTRPSGPAAVQVALREIALASPRRVGPFELAYALHGLFGEEITQETREIEAGGVRVPTPAATRPFAPPVDTETATAGTVSQRASDPAPPELEPEPTAGRSGGLPPWWPVAAGLLVAAGLVAAVALTRTSSEPAPVQSEPAIAAPPVAAGPSPEELEAQIRLLVEQRAGDVAEGLRVEQEAEIRALQEQLALAQREAAPTPSEAVVSKPDLATTPPVPAGGTRPEVPAEAPIAPVSVVPSPPAVAEPAPSSAAVDDTRPPPATSTPPATTPVTTASAEPVSPPRDVPAKGPTPAAATQRGELVTPGPGVTPPSLLRFATPEYPLLARRTKVQGTVVLGILVDENGKPIEVKFLKRIDRDVGLNEAAEKAARASTWVPATKDGVPVKMWFNLPVPFSLE